MLKTFCGRSLRELQVSIEDYERANRLTVDSFSVVYNGAYEALVKFKVRL